MSEMEQATSAIPPSFGKRESAQHIGLALSGGGSRAIAFHLGCLRALHDCGVLDRVSIMSAVSGGAVISALYAYAGDEVFEAFDERVCGLLRRGLALPLGRIACLSPLVLSTLATAATAGILAGAADVARLGVSGVARLAGSRSLRRWAQRLQPPLRRYASRTTALVRVLEKEFPGQMMSDVRHPNLQVVLNACELRSGSAFRFGSRESGCWRYGQVVGNTFSVAEAVAASAAYPLLLPALDRVVRFARRGKERDARVILTDGGVFENLGVSCLEPGRRAEFSTNVVDLDYVISLDAGQGLLDDSPIPYWWASRMSRSFESVFRKVQNASYSRLHKYVETGELSGAIMVFLGQQDERLPFVPPDLVRREEVVDYPTDFSAMSAEDLRALTTRGEQLTRFLLPYYCPELL